MADLIRVDFHIHTHFSPDSLTTARQLIDTARRRKLDRVAVTDHNSIEGAKEAYAMAPELIIMGEEIFTTKGEILALFVKDYIPPRLTPEETIHRLKEQNAFISISHPFDPSRSRWALQDLEEMVPDLDAIEVFNAHCLSQNMNEKAWRFAEKHHLPGSAGSDAHWAKEIGNGYMTLSSFSDADELRIAIKKGRIECHKTHPEMRFLNPLVQVIKRLKLSA